MPYYATNPARVPVGPLQTLVDLPAGVDISDAYLTRIITENWVGFGGTSSTLNLQEWKDISTTPTVYPDNKIRVGWNGAQQSRLAQQFAGGVSLPPDPTLAGDFGLIAGRPEDYGWSSEYNAGEGEQAPKQGVPLYLKAQIGITPQLGLLEDDILYNLALVAVNILEPLKAKFHDIVVVSGFRQVNSGISQHEKGEAVDIRLGNQTPERLYSAADYIRLFLPFDQLVLNYSTQPKQAWIHVSFSAQSLRREVLTRDYDDTFHEGLFLIDELTGEARAAAIREQDEYRRLIQLELDKLSTRDARLNPPVIVGDQFVEGDSDNDEDGPAGIVPDESGVVRGVWESGGGASGWGFVDGDPGESEDPPYTSNAGRFVEAVVSALQGTPYGKQFGWYSKPGGRNYNGRSADGVAFLGSIGDPEQPQANGGFVTFIDILANSDREGGEDPSPTWGPKSPSKDKAKFIS